MKKLKIILSYLYSFISNLEKLEKLKIAGINLSDISFLESTKNIKELEIGLGMTPEIFIKDYSFISKLEKLEKLLLWNTNISNILFLEKNKNIKAIDLRGYNINDFSIISKLKKLEFLSIKNTKISEVSFLKQNKIIKLLLLEDDAIINDFSIISKLKFLNDEDYILYKDNYFSETHRDDNSLLFIPDMIV